MQLFVTTSYERAIRKLITESVQKALSRLVARIKQEEKNR